MAEFWRSIFALSGAPIFFVHEDIAVALGIAFYYFSVSSSLVCSSEVTAAVCQQVFLHVCLSVLSGCILLHAALLSFSPFGLFAVALVLRMLSFAIRLPMLSSSF